MNQHRDDLLPALDRAQGADEIGLPPECAHALLHQGMSVPDAEPGQTDPGQDDKQQQRACIKMNPWQRR